HAEVGYYSVKLGGSGIKAEVTTARRTPIYRFTYPDNKERTLLVDVGHLLMELHDSPHRYHESQVLYSTNVDIFSPTEIGGVQAAVMGWNIQTVPMRVFFYLIADTPAVSSGTWEDGKAPVPGKKWSRYNFPFTLKIGLSFVSLEQAKQNAINEVPGFDFDATRKAAVAAWTKELSTIKIT